MIASIAEILEAEFPPERSRPVSGSYSEDAVEPEELATETEVDTTIDQAVVLAERPSSRASSGASTPLSSGASVDTDRLTYREQIQPIRVFITERKKVDLKADSDEHVRVVNLNEQAEPSRVGQQASRTKRMKPALKAAAKPHKSVLPDFFSELELEADVINVIPEDDQVALTARALRRRQHKVFDSPTVASARAASAVSTRGDHMFNSRSFLYHTHTARPEYVNSSSRRATRRHLSESVSTLRF